MHWKIATSIAAIAAFLAWLGVKHLHQRSPLLALAFIVCLRGLIEAINRCANIGSNELLVLCLTPVSTDSWKSRRLAHSLLQNHSRQSHTVLNDRCQSG
jgi:hypothetical protein